MKTAVLATSIPTAKERAGQLWPDLKWTSNTKGADEHNQVTLSTWETGLGTAKFDQIVMMGYRDQDQAVIEKTRKNLTPDGAGIYE